LHSAAFSPPCYRCCRCGWKLAGEEALCGVSGDRCRWRQASFPQKRPQFVASQTSSFGTAVALDGISTNYRTNSHQQKVALPLAFHHNHLQSALNCQICNTSCPQGRQLPQHNTNLMQREFPRSDMSPQADTKHKATCCLCGCYYWLSLHMGQGARCRDREAQDG
jgi:hypothetical protein